MEETRQKPGISRLLPLFIMAFGSLAAAQGVSERINNNEQNIADNAVAIQANAQKIADNTGAILANTDLADEIVNIVGALESTVFDEFDYITNVIDENVGLLTEAILINSARIDAMDAGVISTDAPSASLPYQIPPAFIVDGGWIEVRWICADGEPVNCDLGMVGDGGNINVLRSFDLPMFVGGRESTTTVNSTVLSSAAADPASYWLGASVDGQPAPEHLWLVHSSGWLHVFESAPPPG
ncbi:MAG: hypothetical protein OXQ29_28075 [Rhodospirillaceae bacterium]|nr:hypothetical protein [Rhodospirillaceae bacterium]